MDIQLASTDEIIREIARIRAILADADGVPLWLTLRLLEREMAVNRGGEDSAR